MEWTLEKWIWSDPKHCDAQTCAFSALEPQDSQYAVVEFRKDYHFEKTVVKASLRFSGDTAFILELNGQTLSAGPVAAGGDFLGNELPRMRHFAMEMTATPNTKEMSFFSRVSLGPVQINEYSRGHGGFMLTGKLTFEDGTWTVICTDETWVCRRNPAYVSPDHFDSSRMNEEWRNAVVIPNRWHSVTAPIPTMEEKAVLQNSCVCIPPQGTVDTTIPLDRIYGGYLTVVAVKAEGVQMTVHCVETDEEGTAERFYLERPVRYRGFRMHSAGLLNIHAENMGDQPAEIELGFIASCYPVDQSAKTVTDDEDLNRVLDVCAHTLRYCRQTLHLDSPRHCEPLACTGDYYIETLMTAASFGDLRLAKLDVCRTADLLRSNDGRMFHTSYSLIWVLMLRDIYRFTADRALLSENLDALVLLLNRFEGYLGQNGLIETPPDYMFVDWLYVDEISLHHPPKALGQTCLNLFYYGALCAAAEIFGEVREYEMSARYTACAESLKNRINALLYDPERGLYFEGLNTPTEEKLISRSMPRNVERRYFRKHANILAAYTGICENAADLLRRTLQDDSLGVVQPYFAHFELEAIYRCGLREEWTLRILEAWKQPVRECAKGLAEGFYKPEPTYSFDHSHAWGGTPIYALPLALLGLEILEPGYKTIRLNPTLLGLERAEVEWPTPFGVLRCHLQKGEEPRYEIPDGISLEG